MKTKFTKYRCFLCSLVAMLLLVGCGSEVPPKETIATQAETMPEGTEPEETETAGISVQTQYITILIPQEYENVLHYQSVSEGNVSMVVFSATFGEQETELYRIILGDEQAGTLLGYLVGEISVPITYTVCDYGELCFEKESDRELYFDVMDSFNEIVERLCEDSRYSETLPAVTVGSHEVGLTFWTVTMPENIQMEEVQSNESYRVDYYGLIQGERVRLYSVGLGEMEADYAVGFFMVGETLRPVNVKVYQPTPGENWTEEDVSASYRMMETVNDVIDTIMESAQFAETLPE